MGFPSGTIEVIPNGIDQDEFRRSLIGRDRLRSAFGLPPNALLIGHVGRFHPMKDHLTFMGACRVLADHRDDIFFLCVSNATSNEQNSLVHAASAENLRGRLNWLGPTRNMSDVYSGMDVFVSSSASSEGFSNVICEAMACEVPCVATNVGDAAWILGPNGIIVPPRNPRRLAEGVLALISGDLVESGRLARQGVISRLNLDKSVKETELVLARACDLEI